MLRQTQQHGSPTHAGGKANQCKVQADKLPEIVLETTRQVRLSPIFKLILAKRATL